MAEVTYQEISGLVVDELRTSLGSIDPQQVEQLIDLMSVKPGKRFGIGSTLEEGAVADLTVFDLNESYTVDPEDFQTMGKSSPFTGRTVFGKCLLTLSAGEIVWQEEGGN